MTQARLELLADSSGIRTATNDLKGLESQSGKTEIATKKLSRATGVTSRQAGHAAFQVQQLVDQVRGGQNFFLAFSQQAADIGFVLGSAGIGAAAGLAAAGIGLLVNALKDGGDGARSLDDVLKSLQYTVSETDSGINVLSDKISKLAKVSRIAAQAKIQEALIETEEAAKSAASEIVGAFSALDASVGLTDAADLINALSGEFSKTARQGKAYQEIIREVGESFGLTGVDASKAGGEIVRLATRLKEFPTPDNFAALESKLAEMSLSAKDGTVEARKLSGSVADYFAKARSAAAITETLTNAQKNLDESLSESENEISGVSSKIARMVEQLQVQQYALEKGELQGQLYAAALATGAESVEMLDGEIAKLITSLYNAEQAKKNEIIATREQVQANRDLIAGLQEEQRVRQAFFSLQSQLAAENNPAEQARQQLQARLDVIREFYGLESNEQALQYSAGVDAEKSYQEQLAKIRKNGADQYQQQQISTLGYTSQFFGTLAQIAEAGGKDSFDSYKLLASAQAGIAAAMAVLQVYADPSITNTYLKIGLAGAIAGLAGAQIKQIQGAEYSGARALGGQVIGGNSYLVGERGPEIITAGSNGNVTPFNQLMSEAREGSASPNFSVNIVNNGSAMVETSQPRFSQEDRAWVLDVFVSDMDRRGKSFGAIKRNTTASGRTI